MTHINQRSDTAANWVLANPVLQDGEVGWEKDTNKAKRGDGSTPWNALGYAITSGQDLSAYALLASPVFTGNPSAPTPPSSDNDTSLATTAFVKNQGYATNVALDAVVDVLTGKAPLNSPVFTGNPTAPTPAAADSDTSIATTAFVKGSRITAGRGAGVVVKSAAGTPTTFVDITFPVGRFASAPFVVVTVELIDNNIELIANTTSITDAGCRVYLYARTGSWTTGSVKVHWMAQDFA